VEEPATTKSGAPSAFNHMAERLQESTERLSICASSQAGRSCAENGHELKNSLTPIRLTVEEMLARYDEADRASWSSHPDRVDEIETLAAHSRLLPVRRRAACAAARSM